MVPADKLIPETLISQIFLFFFFLSQIFLNKHISMYSRCFRVDEFRVVFLHVVYSNSILVVYIGTQSYLTDFNLIKPCQWMNPYTVQAHLMTFISATWSVASFAVFAVFSGQKKKKKCRTPGHGAWQLIYAKHAKSLSLHRLWKGGLIA